MTGPASSVSTFIRQSAWGQALSPPDLDRVLAVTKEKHVPRSGAVIRAASPAHHWVGVISGLVAQSVTHADGYTSFLSAVGDGAWFGEGTLMKRGDWGYDAIALQDTTVALVPLATFEWLRETSLPFNHVLQSLMNARLATYITLVLSTRHASTERRVATAIANLIGAAEHASAGEAHAFVRISQGELALLAGTSRQRVNDALGRLARMGLVQPRRLGVAVLDVDGIHAVAIGEREVLAQQCGLQSPAVTERGSGTA